MILPRRRFLSLGATAAVAGAAAPAAALAHVHHAARHGGHGHGRGHAAAHVHGRHSGHVHEARLRGRHAVEEASAPVHPAAQPLVLARGPRRVNLHNLHTNEKLDAVYYDGDRYVPGALGAVNHVLRDFRTGDMHQISPELLDLLAALTAKTGSQSPVHVISGYRSPQTNRLLRAEGGAETGVAKHSLHMEGEAIDIRLQDVPLHHLHSVALSLGRGGVGFYPVSNFVHVDVGPVRQWSGV